MLTLFMKCAQVSKWNNNKEYDFLLGPQSSDVDDDFIGQIVAAHFRRVHQVELPSCLATEPSFIISQIVWIDDGFYVLWRILPEAIAAVDGIDSIPPALNQIW